MYLHLGQDTLVNTGQVIGFFDLDTTTLGERTREFLARAEKGGEVQTVSSELPKSFVVAAPARRQREKTPTGKGQAVYISQMNTATLKKRLAQAGGIF